MGGLRKVCKLLISRLDRILANDRLIGSIRRECLDHMIILSQRHLRHLLKNYLTYYHWSRTHLALAKDAPEPRAIMRRGEIIAIPQVGGLHHRYERHAA